MYQQDNQNKIQSFFEKMNKQVLINDICYLLLNIFHLVNYDVILFQRRLSLSSQWILYLVVLQCALMISKFIVSFFVKLPKLMYHSEWVCLLLRTHIFLNQILIMDLEIGTLFQVSEIFIQAYIFMVRIKENSYAYKTTTKVYLFIYACEFGYEQINILSISSILEYSIFLGFFLCMNYPRLYSIQEEQTAEKKPPSQRNSRFILSIKSPKSARLSIDRSFSSHHNEPQAPHLDIYNTLPFGVAFIDQRCQVKYMNEKTSDIFQISSIQQLTMALKTFEVHKLPKIRASSNNFLIQYSQGFSSKTINNGKRNSTQPAPSTQFYNLLEIVQNFKNYIDLSNPEPYIIFDKVQSRYLKGQYLVGLAQCNDFTWVNGALVDYKNTFMIFFIGLQSYSKFLSRNISKSLMNQMFRSISHEFGTSLNCFLSLTESALSIIEDPHIKETILQPSFDSCLIMNSIVRDIRDYNQILTKNFNLKILDKICIQEQIGQIIQLFKRQFLMKDIQLEIIIDPQLDVPIMTDPERLSQVLLNLLSNALKHTQEVINIFNQEGIVKIRVTKYIQFNIEYLKFIVQDTGIGMSLEDQICLDEFLNLGVKYSSQSSEESSTFGIGLIISDMISQKLSKLKRSQNGGIQFQSQYNRGSSFSFLVLDFKTIQIQTEGFQPIQRINKQTVISKEKEFLTRRVSLMPAPLKYSSSSIQSDRNYQQFSDSSSQMQYAPPRLSLYNKKHINNKETYQKKNTLQSQSQTQQPSGLGSNPDFILEDVPSEKQIQQNIKYLHNTLTVRNPDYQQKLLKVRRISFDAQITECVCKEILVVDDEYFNILALQILLGTMNLTIDHAHNGQDAIIKFKKNAQKLCHCKKMYKLILMDIGMPIIDGFTATKEILRIAQQQNIDAPVIVAQTAFADYDTQKICYESGMSYFLTKPILRKELHSVMKIMFMI